MARRLLLIMLGVFCLARPVPLGAQAQVLGCDGEPYHQLDFWVGSWNVRLADGTQAGTNVIEKALKGCALFEHWRDVRGNEGKSLLYYQRVRQAWKQVWVLDNGPIKEKQMVAAPAQSVRFQGELRLMEGGSVLDRTTLTLLPDGRVRQLIEQSTDKGATWHSTFEAFYSRRDVR